MPRDKVEVKRIENRASMQVTFSKRRKGLFKKANELAIMCDADVAVIVFSAAKKLTTFGSPSVDEVIERWNKHPDTIEALKQPHLDLDVEQEFQRLKKQHDEAEFIVRQLEGGDLENLSLEQLNQLEEMMQNGLVRVKAKQREHYDGTIAGLQNTIHIMGENGHQIKPEVGVENAVHQERRSTDSVLTANANHEDDHDDILSLRLGPYASQDS
ncbi:MADS transcription factor [Rhynchospora pubera]|uniref:MADS transcription factor n=1 Tax=Rhynchospora pubera TaxID=906938 RepID=A0AAV8C7G4_9POAL|nr:MADS transcription factor [Rhynchospora pubera]